ncbi:MAG: endonuclease/exonuclease/phosphatase family protein [Akkermansiaceae bacterium]|jgi:endonuclease/exonuclease/phosphatase family metal-dependent hydrolase
MKGCFQIAILLLAIVCPVYAGDPHPNTLRVMSYNTWYVFAKGKAQSAGKDFVRLQSPDVVALQELTNIKAEKLKEFAAAWGHPHSCLLKTRGFSVGMTSRWPIEVIEKRLEDMHHGYLHVKSHEIHYILVHLSPFKWEMRKRESGIITTKVKALLAKRERVIVLGDFNATSEADKKWLDADKELIPKMEKSDAKHGHVQNLKDGKLDYSVMESFFNSGLVDTAKDHVPGDAAYRMSFPTGIFTDQKTPPEKGKRIDYILSSADLYQKVKSSVIVREGVVNKISDHYPVITNFATK